MKRKREGQKWVKALIGFPKATESYASCIADTAHPSGNHSEMILLRMA